MENIKAAAKALEAHGFDTRVYETGAEAFEAVMGEIGKASVGLGGSITLNDLGFYDKLQAAGNTVYWHWKTDKDKIAAVRKEAFDADVYLTSSNAVTLDGKLVNIDGVGNRVAGMFYGPQKVIVIVGKNKIAADYDSAIDRIKTKSCGPNARRLNLNTPCAKTDKCTDCSSPDRMCKVVIALERKPVGRDIIVCLVNEELGY